MRYLYCFVLFLFLHIHAYAGVVKGKVSDQAGVTLPYATIYIQGTTMGVSANGNGDYELSLEPGTYKLVCQYIGYKQNSFNITIVGNETITHPFVLKDESTEMKEVVIRASDEDPAYAVIRQAIKRRQFHLDQVKSFHTGLYFKGVMRSRQLPDKFMGQKVKSDDMGLDSTGKGVLYLTEEEAEYYSDGDKEKTIIHSVHESGDRNGLGFSQFPSVITFYNNNVRIFGRTSRGYISPISDNALNYYKYKMLGTFEEHGRIINKIQVTQKRLYEPCFNGVIYIAEDEWTIHSLDMTLLKQSGMDMIDTLKLEQVFLPLKKDSWVIKSQLMYFTIKFMVFDVTATGVAVYNNQHVNEPIPDSVFGSNIISQYDKTANKKDTSHWQNRPVPLAEDEQRDFVLKDSISKVINSPAYRDSVRKKQNKFKPVALLIGESVFYGKEYKKSIAFNSLLLGLGTDNMLNFNTLEGINIAPKIKLKHVLDTGKVIAADVAVRYGFSNTHFNAIGRLFYTSTDRAWLNRTWQYGVEGGKYVFQYNGDNPVIPMLNTYRSLLARQNDLKLYERWEAAAFVKRNYGNGWTWSLKGSFQQRLLLENITTYTFAKATVRGYTDNTPAVLQLASPLWQQHNAFIVNASLTYKPGFTYTQFPDYKVANGSSWPRFTLSYQKGIAGILDSKTDFDKWKFSISDDVNLKLLGSFRYNFITGGFLNTAYVALPDKMHLNGIRGVGYAAPYMRSFQFAPYYLFSNTAKVYGEGHIEYHLNGLISNKIPLLRQARYYLLFGGNAFYSGANSYYVEAFAGIDNIGWKLLRILRVDFVQSWDSYKGRNSGVRFGINMRGVSVVRNNASDSEW